MMNRIYTEVVWQWDDSLGQMVEVSSQSESYSGEMALCAAGDLLDTTSLGGFIPD